MKPLHEELKIVRLQKDISLEEIAKKTKIRLDFLERIEEGDYTVTPSPFVRAFLREYAEVVGIDPDLVMQKFDNKIDSIHAQETNEDPVDEEQKHQKHSDTKEIPPESEYSSEIKIISETQEDGEKTSKDTENISAEADIEKSDAEKDDEQTSLFNKNDDKQKEL